MSEKEKAESCATHNAANLLRTADFVKHHERYTKKAEKTPSCVVVQRLPPAEAKV